MISLEVIKMPGQFVFGAGRDMVFNVQHLTDWTAIKAHKQQIIQKKTIIFKIQNKYQVEDLVMLKNSRANKYEQPYSKPYCITQVNTNGTVSQNQCSHRHSRHMMYPSIQDSQFQLWGQVQYVPS